VRDLAIYVNASAQRQERFVNTQTRRQPLSLIQDVATRWNSTFNMLVRARELREEIASFVEGESKVQDLSTTEWQHIDYLIQILYPFCVYTNAIGATVNGPTIHTVFHVYNRLFDHLDDQIQTLQRKRIPWKRQLRDALQKGREKLKSYYGMTKGNLDHIYGVSTILAPEYKIDIFSRPEWGDSSWVCILIITKIITIINKFKGDQYLQKVHELWERYHLQQSGQDESQSTSFTSLQSFDSSSQVEPPSSPPRPPINHQVQRQPSLSAMKRKAPDLGSLLGKKKKIAKTTNVSEIQQYLDDTYRTLVDYYNDYYNN
jgi:hypothetical protein